MKIDQEFKDNYEKEMHPLIQKMDGRYWEKSNATAIGGAGFSVATIFLLTQIYNQNNTFSLWLALLCASIALPLWLGLWQGGEAYAMYGKNAYSHFAKLSSSGLGVLIYAVSCILSLISMFCIVFHFSALAGLLFLIISLAMTTYVFKHHVDVKKYSDAKNENSE